MFLLADAVMSVISVVLHQGKFITFCVCDRVCCAVQGLGEVYEAEYVKAATGFSAPDKQDRVRQEATALFKALCAKLDALSSFSYTPKPFVTEMEVRLRSGGAVLPPRERGKASRLEKKAEAAVFKELRQLRILGKGVDLCGF
jgi:hypothetical protein